MSAHIPSLDNIASRLPLIFPEGIEHRNYVVREMAAKTIFVMFYVDAIEGTGLWLRPDQVTKMSNAQAVKGSEEERLAWTRASLIPGEMKNLADRWYAQNTREPIRDETLRSGLIPTGAVVERTGLPTTSAKPRYALNREFAALFEEGPADDVVVEMIRKWQERHLNPGALARIRLLKAGAVAGGDEQGVLVTFPSGETRLLATGPSSTISKAVIEVFAPHFLQRPGVIFLSESGNKVVARDDQLARSIGLKIMSDRHLPDMILVDIDPPQPLLIFVEVVATDGAVTAQRKRALLEIAVKAGFAQGQVAFVSAFTDRGSSAYRKLGPELAWGSFAWFISEPEKIVLLHEQGEKAIKKLSELL